MFLSGYNHYLRAAASLRWDEAAVDLRADAAAFAALPDPDRERVRTLLAGFCVGEGAVARDLEPFVHVSASAEMAKCFEAQRADEERHARFFDRVAVEVLSISGRNIEDRRSRLTPSAPAGLVELFERRLPAAVARLRADPGGFHAAVALYHILIEGVVFAAGQLTLLELARARSLSGLAEGVERVLLDERWHVGFGTSLLAQKEVPGDAVGALACEASSALAAWGNAVPAAIGARVLQLHRRRVAAGGISTEEVVA